MTKKFSNCIEKQIKNSIVTAIAVNLETFEEIPTNFIFYLN